MLAPELKKKPAMRPFLSATRRFADGADTPRAFLEQCLAELTAWEPQVGAFVALDLAGARAAADRSSARWRAAAPLSPIDGMPVGIKDIIETADMPTEMGSPLFAGWRSNKDAACVAALRQAGAVIVGKTVTTEFAASEPRGTRNPWNLDHTPGGSSSGSAAAVGSGMISAGLGTQVIGSTLRPASFCGCFGFKPTVNALNREGCHDYQSQSCTGILAATLEDTWQVAYEIVARVGGDAGTPGLTGPAKAPAPARPRRLVFLETSGWAGASAAAQACLQDALQRLKTAGIEIVTRHDDPKVAEIENELAGGNRAVHQDQRLGDALVHPRLPRPRRQQAQPRDAGPIEGKRNADAGGLPRGAGRARPHSCPLRGTRGRLSGVREPVRSRAGAGGAAIDRQPAIRRSELAARHAGAVIAALPGRWHAAWIAGARLCERGCRGLRHRGLAARSSRGRLKAASMDERSHGPTHPALERYRDGPPQHDRSYPDLHEHVLALAREGLLGRR